MSRRLVYFPPFFFLFAPPVPVLAAAFWAAIVLRVCILIVAKGDWEKFEFARIAGNLVDSLDLHQFSYTWSVTSDER